MITRGIYFNAIHSYYDLNLILSKVEIPPAKPKTNYIDIAGADGSIDLTEAHGEVKFNDRDCKFTFTMNPKYDLSDAAFEEKKTEISNLLNGRTFKITLDKDADYYYEGRCTVDEFLSNKRIRQFVVSAKVKPYKFKQNETVFTYNLTTTQETVEIKNSRKTVSPIFEVSNDDTMIVFNGTSYSLTAGKHKILDIRFKEGVNELKLSGSGTLTVRFQEGDL
jgi:hypothetical protein